MTKRKTEPLMSKDRTLIEQGSWTSSTNSLQRLRERTRQVPSIFELKEIYDGVVPQSSSQLTPQDLVDVIEILNKKFSVDFQASDAARLHRMISNSRTGATRSAFIDAVFSLLCALKSSKMPLSFSQLRIIMGTAFERFDVNADGDLSLEEFSAALLSFDINIGLRETKILLQFLSLETSGSATVLNKEDFVSEGTQSLEEQCLTAVTKAKDKVAEITGWTSAVAIRNKVEEICLGEGNLEDKVKRVQQAVGVEQVADSTELALTVASVALVLMNDPAHAAGQDMSVLNLGNQVNFMASSFASDLTALFQSGPMGPIMLSALLAASKAMRKQEMVALGGDEALLYVQSFQHKGCSLGVFHKLIACIEYRWGSAQPGDFLLLNSVEPELKILLRGKGRRKSVEVGPGAVLMKHSEDDKVEVFEPMTYIAWNVRKLTKLVKNTRDPALVKLVSDMIQEADPGFEDFGEKEASERPKNVNGLLAALRDSIELQAKRKGLSMCFQLAEGLQRLILNTKTSGREKANQCQALLMESADELMEGLEALADFAGAVSAFVAITTHAGEDFSSMDIMQLAPLFMLASLTIGKTVN